MNVNLFSINITKRIRKYHEKRCDKSECAGKFYAFLVQKYSKTKILSINTL